MRRKILMIFFLVFIFPSLALADEYVLVKGKGIEVCEEYGKNLNSLVLKEYMVCERKINPKFTDFKKPEWQEIDLWKNREFLRKVECFLGLQSTFGDPDKNLQEWEKFLKWRLKDNATTIMIARVDIDNDGKDENVIKYFDGRCPAGKHFGIAILVLNEDKSEIDIKKTTPLLQNLRVINKSLTEGWEFSMYDVFSYKNKIYFDRWSESFDQTGYLKIFMTKSEGGLNVLTEEICRYRYKTEK